LWAARRVGYLGPEEVKVAEGKRFVNASGIPLAPSYEPDGGAPREIGRPGEFPYTRGIRPQMYRERLWTMRQYAGMGTAEETNHRFRTLLDRGQTGLSTAFDLPTQMGLDSDDPRARGEVGRVGVAIDSVEDMALLFEGIPLERVSTSMTINAPAAVLLAMYVVVGERQGVDPRTLSGTIQNDILKEYVARGTFIFPPRPSMRLATDVIEYCARELPRFNSISVSGYHIRDAGADAVTEMAFAVANAIEYIQWTLRRGVEIDAFAPRISWIFNTQSDFFEEVAKYRALRRLWAKLLRDRFGAKDERSWLLRTHTQTGGATLTAQQPENNIVRATIQALAAVLGGVQSLALSCYDEALGIPTDKAQEIALRTQQIIAHETGVASVADPLGGSWYVEWLTDELERRALAELEKVERLGGALSAVENGYMQKVIADAAYREQCAVEKGSKVVVGVNRYTDTVMHETPPLLKVDPDLERLQVERLRERRRRRDPAPAQKALARLVEAARGDTNLLPFILDAVRAHATVGEICGALRSVWGTHRGDTTV
jgi:methylmalonyl-CoA mutase N-terminal domain/subunit